MSERERRIIMIALVFVIDAIVCGLLFAAWDAISKT